MISTKIKNSRVFYGSQKLGIRHHFLPVAVVFDFSRVAGIKCTLVKNVQRLQYVNTDLCLINAAYIKQTDYSSRCSSVLLLANTSDL